MPGLRPSGECGGAVCFTTEDKAAIASEKAVKAAELVVANADVAVKSAALQASTTNRDNISAAYQALCSEEIIANANTCTC